MKWIASKMGLVVIACNETKLSDSSLKKMECEKLGLFRVIRGNEKVCGRGLNKRKNERRNFHRFFAEALCLGSAFAGVCVCSADVVFREGFVEKLIEVIDEIGLRGYGDFILSGYAPYSPNNEINAIGGKYFSMLPPAWFYGTQCLFFTQKSAAEAKLFVQEHGESVIGEPSGVIVNRFCQQGTALFVSNRSLVQHTGSHDEDCPDRIFHQSPTFSLPWPGAEEDRLFDVKRRDAGEAMSTSKISRVPNAGHGIVICAGGMKYFGCAWACVKLLRHLGCTLPIEFWHLGPDEMSAEMRALVKPLGVRCVDAWEVRKKHPARILNGWELKCYAILHSRFREVLLLDADNVAVVNPEFLFETPEYREHGAIFWPDIGSIGAQKDIWKITGVDYREEPAFESGQIIVDKGRCWRAMNLAMHYNEHSDFYYQYIYGDKDTFHFAFRKVGKSYAMPSREIDLLDGTLCQHDFAGRRIFQHRIKKWKLEGNSRTPGFLFEDECIGYLEELRGLLAPKVEGKEADGIDGMRRIKGMKRNGMVPNPAPPTVELVKVKRGDARVVKHRELLEAVAKQKYEYPARRLEGRGIVICGGGAKYFPCVFVLVRLLRHLGCGLPIEVWHLGAKEMTPMMRGLLEEAGRVGKLAASPTGTVASLRCVDGLAVRRRHPARRLGGWEMKCYAILHSRFAEVVMLDADNCPVRDPGFLFESAGYRKTGAVFWPDFGRFVKGQAVWAASGIKYRDEPEFESGQMVIDKARCWRALNVAMHLNEHSEWWYRLVHGDKDTFHLAWRKIGQDYAMPGHPVRALDGVMLQYDFAGKLLFQHRNFGKWTLEKNRRVPGFRLEKECLGFVEELRVAWQELPVGVRRYAARGKTKGERTAAERLCAVAWEYRRVGHDRRALRFLPDGRVGEGLAGCEVYWDVRRV